MAGIDLLRRLSLKKERLQLWSIGHPGAATPCELPGAPLIFSITLPFGARMLSRQHFKNTAVYSKLRAWFRKWQRRTIPVVLLATFYVKPFDHRNAKLTKKQLREEKTPATYSFELLDYTLSLIESLRHAELFLNPAQIVKIDVQKFYSSNPRTVFRYMRFEDWQHFYCKDPVNPKAKAST